MGKFFSFIPILALGFYIFSSDVKENVKFEKDGSGNASIVLNLRDLKVCLPGLLHCGVKQSNKRLDSLAIAFTAQVKGMQGITDAKAVFDSVRHSFSYNFSFADTKSLNEMLVLFNENEDIKKQKPEYYTFSKKQISRCAIPLFAKTRQIDSILRVNNAPLKSAYHAYWINIGMPDGTYKLQPDNEYAYIQQKGVPSVQMEIDMNKIFEGTSLLTHIKYRTF
jgi:hypothetical protein